MRCLGCILVLLYGVGDAQATGLKSGATASQSLVTAVKPAKSRTLVSSHPRHRKHVAQPKKREERHRVKTAVEAWAASPFARCVRLRESHDGADPNAANNLYGMQARNAGYAGGTSYSWARHVSRRAQDRLAYRLFLKYGDGPWRPYDGCVWTGV